LNQKFGLDSTKEIILILPGSRKQEVKTIFPEAIKAASKIADEFDMQIVVACSSNLDENVFYELTDQRKFKVIKDQTYDLLKQAKFGVVKSGTSTLEAGLMELPFIIVYKTSWLTYTIGKTLVEIKNIGMANILLNEQVVPELIQGDVNSDRIYEEAKNILRNNDLYQKIKQKLSRIKQILGDKNAPENAAKIIYSLLNERKTG
jgi:lipid-A-disaccharide synthase